MTDRDIAELAHKLADAICDRQERAGADMDEKDRRDCYRDQVERLERERNGDYD